MYCDGKSLKYATTCDLSVKVILNLLHSKRENLKIKKKVHASDWIDTLSLLFESPSILFAFISQFEVIKGIFIDFWLFCSLNGFEFWNVLEFDFNFFTDKLEDRQCFISTCQQP